MLNEWSDRPEPKPCKRRFGGGHFWLGVATIFMSATLLVAFGQRLFGG